MAKHDGIVSCLADLTAEPVQWLWPERLAAGKLALLDGDPNQPPPPGAYYGNPQTYKPVRDGLTLGFYSNKSGEAVLTGTQTGTTLSTGVYNALFAGAACATPGGTP